MALAVSGTSSNQAILELTALRVRSSRRRRSLSTGLAINSSSDNPSGAAIAAFLQAGVNGTDQATQNDRRAERGHGRRRHRRLGRKQRPDVEYARGSGRKRAAHAERSEHHLQRGAAGHPADQYRDEPNQLQRRAVASGQFGHASRAAPTKATRRRSTPRTPALVRSVSRASTSPRRAVRKRRSPARRTRSSSSAVSRHSSARSKSRSASRSTTTTSSPTICKPRSRTSPTPTSARPRPSKTPARSSRRSRPQS